MLQSMEVLQRYCHERFEQPLVEGSGAWTKAEHARFLTGIQMYPNGPWKKITDVVQTRSIRQVQSHAQKYREKIARWKRGLKTSTKRKPKPNSFSDDSNTVSATAWNAKAGCSANVVLVKGKRQHMSSDMQHAPPPSSASASVTNVMTHMDQDDAATSDVNHRFQESKRNQTRKEATSTDFHHDSFHHHRPPPLGVHASTMEALPQRHGRTTSASDIHNTCPTSPSEMQSMEVLEAAAVFKPVDDEDLTFLDAFDTEMHLFEDDSAIDRSYSVIQI